VPVAQLLDAQIADQYGLVDHVTPRQRPAATAEQAYGEVHRHTAWIYGSAASARDRRSWWGASRTIGCRLKCQPNLQCRKGLPNHGETNSLIAILFYVMAHSVLMS